MKVALRRRIEIARPPRAAVAEVDAPAVVDLIVRVGAHIDPGGELNPRRRLDEDLLAREKVADKLRRIVRRLLRKEQRRRLDESALRDDLRRCGVRKTDGKSARPTAVPATTCASPAVHSVCRESDVRRSADATAGGSPAA